MKAKRPKLWLDPKVLAKSKGKHATGEEEPIVINRYLELADLVLKADAPKKAA